MPFLKSMPANAGPPAVYMRFPEIYGPWSKMSQALMNGPSPFSEGERELIFAYAAGVSACEFVYVAHAEVAYVWGIEPGLVERLLQDLDSAPIEPRLKPLLTYVRTLSLSPNAITQADVDTVLNAGWTENALLDAIALTARAAFMHRLVGGCGFTPLTREVARKHARKRVDSGYVNQYAAFREDES